MLEASLCHVIQFLDILINNQSWIFKNDYKKTLSFNKKKMNRKYKMNTQASAK